MERVCGRERPDQEMIPDLEITPEDIAEAALLPFRMSRNVVLEVRLECLENSGASNACPVLISAALERDRFYPLEA